MAIDKHLRLATRTAPTVSPRDTSFGGHLAKARHRAQLAEHARHLARSVPSRLHLAAVLAVALIAAGCGSATPSAAAPATPSAAAPTSPRPNLPNGPIDIGGGRHLNVNCGGSGVPVVILDAGLGNTSAVWTPVARIVRDFATVCSYDRASLGGSDFRPLPHGAESAVDDLHALLSATRLPGPYVLVGASFGGLDMQIFARRYPSDAAGVVLVDSLASGWDHQLEATLSPAQVAERRAIPNGEEISNEEIRSSEDAAGTGPAFPPVSLVVLRHGQPFPGGPDWPTAKVEALWSSLQADLARLSPRSTSLLAAESGHRIHEQQPDLVADAIHAIVDPSRWPPTAPASKPGFGAGASPVAVELIPGLVVFSAADGLQEARADGSNTKLIVPNGDALVSEPSVDASGRFLAYTRRNKPAQAGVPQTDTGSEVWVTDTVAGTSNLVAPDGQMPRVSPDGTSIAFDKQGHTYLVRPDGTGLRDLAEGGCPVWSPDSTRLAMCTSADTVFILTIADGQRTSLASGPSLLNPTAWSPDGKSVALVSFEEGNGEVYLIDADGSNEHRLTTAPGNQFAGLWISNGLVITSSLPDADASDWFLVDPATGDPRTISWMHGVPDPVAYVAAP